MFELLYAVIFAVVFILCKMVVALIVNQSNSHLNFLASFDQLNVFILKIVTQLGLQPNHDTKN